MSYLIKLCNSLVKIDMYIVKVLMNVKYDLHVDWCFDQVS